MLSVLQSDCSFSAFFFLKLIQNISFEYFRPQELALSELDLPGVTSSGWGHIVHRGVSFCSCLAFLHVPNKFFSLTSSRQLLLISYFSFPFSGINLSILSFSSIFFLINICTYHLSHLLFTSAFTHQVFLIKISSIQQVWLSYEGEHALRWGRRERLVLRQQFLRLRKKESQGQNVNM